MAQGQHRGTGGHGAQLETAHPPVGTGAESPACAHPSEKEFAQILDFYGLNWVYEPRSFPLRWDGDRVVEMMTPDFFLLDLDLYVELTTMKPLSTLVFHLPKD